MYSTRCHEIQAFSLPSIPRTPEMLMIKSILSGHIRQITIDYRIEKITLNTTYCHKRTRNPLPVLRRDP